MSIGSLLLRGGSLTSGGSLLGGKGKGSVSYDTAAQALFDAWADLTSPYVPDATRKGLVNDLIVALKAAGSWTTRDSLWVFACGDATAALLDWKNPVVTSGAPAGTAITLVGTPSFTTDQGYAGSSNTNYLLGSENLSALTQYAQDDCSMGVYSLTNSQQSPFDMGLWSTTSCFIRPRNTSDVFSARTNTAGTASSGAATDSRGLFMVCRTGATAEEIFRNGSSVATGTATSIARSAAPPTVCGANGSTSAHVIGMAYVGADLTSEAAADFAAFHTYMQTVASAP